MNPQPLVDKNYLLQKFPGKGGWTYAEIPEVSMNKDNPFGWVTVRGKIDDYEFRHMKLMPMGNGHLFFAVKAEIRKKIKKQAGDWVRITLYHEVDPISIPSEIENCFANETPEIRNAFLRLTQGEQKAYLDWIYSAKKDETKISRIVEMIENGLT